MKPETRKYLAKARSDLADARKIAGIGLAKVAARSAYFAVFHAAEGFIFERSGKVARTHSGVRSEFARLARAAPGIDRSFSSFLAEAYKYKDISDYRVDESGDVTMDEANAAIASAERHLSGIASFLESRMVHPRPERSGAPLYGWFTEGFDTLDLKEAKTWLATRGGAAEAAPRVATSNPAML